MRYFVVFEGNMKIKVIGFVMCGIAICALLYALLVFLVIFICWITGNPPAHLIPGMTSYDEWNWINQ